MDAGHDQRRLALGTSEAYVEYARDGRIVRGAAKAVAKSKYAEDVLINNHTAVWGSYFDRRRFKWGFADDHSTEKNSYSTGAAGRAAGGGTRHHHPAPGSRLARQSRSAMSALLSLDSHV